MNEQSHRVDGGVKGETAVMEQYQADDAPPSCRVIRYRAPVKEEI